MDDFQKEYQIQRVAHEACSLSYAEKIRFKERLIDILANHRDTLTKQEVIDAEELLNRLQGEIKSE